jgi:hypothetical protein
MRLKFPAAVMVLALVAPAFADDAQEQQTPPAAEQPPPQEAPPELKKAVDALSKLKFSGYVQAQYVNDESSANELGGSTGTRNRDQFSVRRARIKATYQATRTSKLVFAPDVSSSGATLKDAWIELTEPWTSWKHTLTAGQYTWPFGFELQYSSSNREVPERSRVIRALFPGERDRGLMLSGRGLREKFRYQVAIVNGTGTVRSDDLNQEKDIVGRVGYAFGKLDLGASLYRGTDLVATTANSRGQDFDKHRHGMDFQWSMPLPGLAVRGEYITGRQAPPTGTTRTESFDVAGWYLYVIQNVGKKHQFAVRADEYDGNTDAADDAVLTIGGSYIFHWDANSKVMLAYERPRNEVDDPDDNIFTLRYQFSF